MHRKYLAMALLLTALLAGCAAKPTPAQPPTQPTGQPATQPKESSDYGYGSTTQQPPAQQQQPPVQQQPPPAAKPGLVEVTVKLSEYSFDPDTITVPLGAQVKLTIVNEGTKSHDLEIQGAYNIKSEILPNGQTQVLTFAADKAGEIQIICGQRGHREKGMTATLVVK